MCLFLADEKFSNEQLDITTDQLKNFFYIERGKDAIHHFFHVVSGLNSQIIGDYEIVGQVKKSIQMAREFGLVGTLTDRVSSYAFQASKQVKIKTNLSSGKYSVSYAAAELINDQQNEKSFNDILIVGTGQIGQAMARNLKEYFPKNKFSLTNRTLSHAQDLGSELNVNVIPFEKFIDSLHSFDVVITTAESDNYLITVDDIPTEGMRLFLDLSIPQVIDPQIKSLTNSKHYSVDEISEFHNELMKQRHLEIPKAESIIEEHCMKLMEWQTVFRHTEIILSYKEKMGRIIHIGDNHPVKTEKIFSGLIQQIKSEGYSGCSVIETVNVLLALEK